MKEAFRLDPALIDTYLGGEITVATTPSDLLVRGTLLSVVVQGEFIQVSFTATERAVGKLENVDYAAWQDTSRSTSYVLLMADAMLDDEGNALFLTPTPQGTTAKLSPPKD